MVLKQRPKDNQIGAEVKVDIFVVEMLLAAGEETHGFWTEAEEGLLEQEWDKDLEEGTMRHLIHLHAMCAGCVAIWARDCPQSTTASRGCGISNNGNQSRFVHRGTSGNRSRGTRTRFSGLNVVYDAEGQWYPVDDSGMIYIPADEQIDADVEEQPQQENC